MSFRCFASAAGCFLLAVMPACDDAKDPEPQGTADQQRVSDANRVDTASDETSDDPKAMAIMQKAADFLKSRKSTKVDVTIDVVMRGGGFDQTNTTNCQARFESPNRLAIDVADDSIELKAISDGEQLYVAMMQDDKYTVDEAPESFAEVGNPFLDGIMQGPIGPAVPGSDLRKSIFADATQAAYVGRESINDKDCDHIRYKQTDVTSDVWVDASDRAVIHKIVQDMSEKMRKMAGQSGGHGDFKMEISFQFKDWEVDADLNLAKLAFEPTAGMEKVDSLFDGSAGEADATELIGMEAPDFVIELLDGNSVDLKSHRGKNIVLLDFWATWCGPCVRAMPTIATVADAFKEDGVVLYAVNQQESPEQIKSFLKSNKLNVKVALDADGNVGSLYRASAIPQTVIIGKDGRVQAVHVGLLPDLEERLRSELRTLADGEDLVPAKEAPTAADDASTEVDSPDNPSTDNASTDNRSKNE